MIMTYAAQVRSLSKSLPKQLLKDDLYDINSLRIICQYFVGSVVSIKTADEILEGILHTISNNTICLTMVTVTPVANPDKIIKMSSSKMISLNDVLCISTKDSSDLDVTVNGKYIKTEQDMKTSSHVVTNGQKVLSKTLNNKLLKTNIMNEENKAPVVVETPLENTEKPDTNIQAQEEQTGKKITPKSNSDVNEGKKMFSFNPNAPEFKPRPFVSYSNNVTPEPILFSPSAQPYPHVFTPTSAPAIFVPNLFFYAPNPINTVDTPVTDHGCIDSSIGFQPHVVTDFHIPNNNAHTFSPVVPIFQHPLPIFIPNQPYKVRKGEMVSSESGNTTDISVSNENNVDNELSNPSNWPPLPNPVLPPVSATVATNNDVTVVLKKSEDKP